MVINLSLGGLVLTMSASMTATALSQMGHDLELSLPATQLALSIYLLGLAFGPFVIGPCSEMYGRKLVWMFCNEWYILFNALCPINQSSGIVIAGRFLSGLGSSVGIAVSSILSCTWNHN